MGIWVYFHNPTSVVKDESIFDKPDCKRVHIGIPCCQILGKVLRVHVTLLKRTCWNTLIWIAMKFTFWRPTMGTAVSIHLFGLFKVLLILLLRANPLKERSKSLYPLVPLFFISSTMLQPFLWRYLDWSFHSLSLWTFFLSKCQELCFCDFLTNKVVKTKENNSQLDSIYLFIFVEKKI